MESSRRSAVDRSREPGLKRPRLAADDAVERDRIAASRDRSLPPSRASGQSLIPRPPRAGEREERDDPVRVGSHQELVVQYKTALAELTFNSKPIITNLTIIAGENLHVAKEIAAVICANVLEVPSEQKLPSLYLLDSIVKNIGRDYIKHFAARLPEVFCKAYKQVDSSIHPSMRHLFGTWKGVFPPTPLQIIEKELGFPPVINGSSGSASSKLDAQPQRPAHSIHVNPKYLEARQRLQQSSRAKDISNDEVSGAVSTFDEVERTDRIATVGNSRHLANLPTKLSNTQQPQREIANSVIHDKKVLKDVRDYEYSSDFPQEPDIGIERVNERLKGQDGHGRPYYGAGITSTGAQLSRRNGYDVNQSYGSRVSGSTQANNKGVSVDLGDTERKKFEASRSWKNSEEEEYMWDDMKTRTDFGGSSNSRKGGHSGDAEKFGSLQRGKWISLETEQFEPNMKKVDNFSRLVNTTKGEGRLPPYKDLGEHIWPPHAEHDTDSGLSMGTSSNSLLQRRASSEHTSSLWAHHETPAEVGFSYKRSRVDQLQGQSNSFSGGLPSINSSLPMPGLRSSVLSSSLGPNANLPLSLGSFGQQRSQPSQHPSLSSHSHPSSEAIQQLKPYNSADQDHLQSHSFSQMGQKPLHLAGQTNKAQHLPGSLDIFSAKNHVQPFDTLSNSVPSLSDTSQHLEGLVDSATSASFDQPRDHPHFIQQSQHNMSKQQAETQPLIPSETQIGSSLQRKTQSQASHQTEKLPPPPLGLGSHQAGRDSSTSHSNIVESSGQPSTSSLLAAIMNSGLFSNNSVSNFQKPNMQPPLPVGPPPVRMTTSDDSLSVPQPLSPPISLDNLPDPKVSHLPPLPPGPPPSSSSLAAYSESSKTSGPTMNPLSSLLSSLVAKGLISSPSTESPTTSAVQVPNRVQDQKSGFVDNSLKQLPSTLATSGTPLVSAEGPASSKLVASAPLSQSTATESKDLIGTEFKSEILRGFHPSVIRSLFEDLKHQCHICGLRFRLQEQLQCHFDWHALKESEIKLSKRFRKWFTDTKSSEIVVLQSPFEAAILLEEMNQCEENSEPMVPADESQSICALCGEPFEDIYSEVRDEWMYKGTVYLDLPSKLDNTSNMVDDTDDQLPIVHSHCLSQRSCSNMDIIEDDKVEQPYAMSGIL
ncbi:hypothetical protein Cni_G24817 [Canna indica]|uniref:CID domain-containing protein n=1 Tax=Canna indica TaxID=4628 RepID=A0AAQ3QPX7_9LILI|nr:hypothetical protein Cni_G24817 [Canna indica]